MSEQYIRKAKKTDACRIAEIEIFNYRLYFYPIFQSDAFYFEELQVKNRAGESLKNTTYVYDDGVVKGFIRLDGAEIEKLFVEPVLHGRGIGAALLRFAVGRLDVRWLWALEKNERAIAFYQRNGFQLTSERKREDGTEEYLIKMVRR